MKNKIKLFWLIIIIFVLQGCDGKATEKQTQSGLLTKKLFYQDDLTKLTGLVKGDFGTHLGKNIGVIDQFSLSIIDYNSNSLIEKICFDDCKTSILDPSIVFGVINKPFAILSKGPSDCRWLDENGYTKWRYHPLKDEFPNAMTVGDLDNNGIPEFYLATNFGVYKVGIDGNDQWKMVNDEVYRIETLINNAGSRIVALINYKNQFQLRDYQGNVVSEFILPFRIYDFELVNWPKDTNILTYSKNNIYVLDLNGSVFLEYRLEKTIYDIKGAPVRFYEKDRPCLSVIADYSSSIGKSMLLVFSAKGDLIYKEMIKSTMGILPYKPKNGTKEVLLVGSGPGEVYEYRSVQ